MSENTPTLGKYPDTFYRVSIKAVIKNEQGEMLAIKAEGNTEWGLPGGGIDHGETDHECLRRELHEELCIPNELNKTFRKITTAYHKNTEAWKLFVVYDVRIIGEYEVCLGDAIEAKFIPIAEYNANKIDIEPEVEE
jgi:8-oxo-dGTP pyrophosphatase MutT (NUDIX family)